MFGWAHVYSQNELGGKQNGIPDIVKAMERHVGLAEVQDAGIRALANLVYNHSDNVLRAVKDKGIEAVIAAMREHPAEVSVQEGGCLFIWSILATVRNESYITYGLEMTGAPGAGHVAGLSFFPSLSLALSLRHTHTHYSMHQSSSSTSPQSHISHRIP